MKLMKQRVLSLTLIAVSVLAMMVAADRANASVEKIILTNEMVTDAETGKQAYKILNPKQEADITFTSFGLEVKFEDVSGKTQTVRLFADFQNNTEKPSSEGEARYIDMMNTTLATQGIQLAGALLKQTAKRMIEEGGVLVLKFDTSRKIGFVVREYSFSETYLVASGSASASLAEVTGRMASAQANKAVEAFMAERASKIQELAPKERPIGFLHDQKPSAWGGPKMIPMCEPLFIPVGL